MKADPDIVWKATVAAALLRQSRWPGAAATGVALLAIAGAALSLATGRPAAAVANLLSLAAGVAAIWLTIRVSFDAELFAALASDMDLAAFDRAMLELGLMPGDRAGRVLEPRIAGAMRLMKLQVLTLAIEVAMILVAGWLACRTGAP